MQIAGKKFKSERPLSHLACLSADTDIIIKNKPLKIELHSSFSLVEKAWMALERSALTSPFQRVSWIKSLMKNFDHTKAVQPLFVSGYRNGALILAMPLALESDLRGKRLTWLGSDVCDYNGIICDQSLASELPNAFLSQIVDCLNVILPGIDVAHLTRIPAHPDFPHSVDCKRSELIAAEYDSHTLSLSSDWTSLYAQLRSAKSRQRLRSKYNALKKEGRLIFKQVKQLEDKIEATQKILDWKSQQLDQRGSRNPFGTPGNPSLIKQSIQTSIKDEGDHGLKVFGLYQNDKLIAGMLAFVDARNFYYFVSAYSDELSSKYSVGSQLLIKTMQFACRANLKRYDFLIGDEAYKFDWCNGTIPLLHYVKPLTQKGQLFCMGLKGQLALKKYVSEKPAFARAIRHMIKTRRVIELVNENATTDSVSQEPGLNISTQSTLSGPSFTAKNQNGVR
ncbi:MAG: GNAT family N-acetyltransferase [Pseudomonadota bacterium]